MLRKRIVLIAVLLTLAFPATSAAIERENSNTPGRVYENRPFFSHDRMLRQRERPYDTPYEFFGNRYYETGEEKYLREDYRPDYRHGPNYQTWGDK